MADSQNTIFQDIHKGFCQCGCGKHTNIAKQTRTNAGWVKGHPFNFIHGHQGNGKPGQRGCDHPHWKGGKRQRTDGYIEIYHPCHHRAGTHGYVFEHVLVAERILGRPLKDGETVHHIDENRQNNENDNIYIFCIDAAHKTFHQRLIAFNSCGHWNWRKCKYCHTWDAPTKLVFTNHRSVYHKQCANDYAQTLKKRKQLLQVFN